MKTLKSCPCFHASISFSINLFMHSKIETWTVLQGIVIAQDKHKVSFKGTNDTLLYDMYLTPEFLVSPYWHMHSILKNCWDWKSLFPAFVYNLCCFSCLLLCLCWSLFTWHTPSIHDTSSTNITFSTNQVKLLPCSHCILNSSHRTQCLWWVVYSWLPTRI